MAAAERELSLRLEADIASLAPLEPWTPFASESALERLELKLAGNTDTERRLLGLLAYRRAERGISARQSADLAERALRGDHLFTDAEGSTSLFGAGLALGLAGHTGAAEQLFHTLAERARSTRSWATFCAAVAQRGIERWRRGALPDAMDDLRAALDAARGQPWESIVDDGRAHLLRVYSETGQLEAAERELHAWCATGPLPDTAFGNRLLIERGRLRLSQGRLAEATQDLDSIRARVDRYGDSIAFEWRSPAAIAQHRIGEQDAALELARADLEMAKAWGAPRQLAIAIGTMGLIEGGREGIQRLREAAELLERCPARLERARTLIILGSLLRRIGEPSQARGDLQLGFELASECGATALAARAQEEVAATGVRRRRRRTLSGPEALTPSEDRVARLAARGLSNPDIARTLFVTRKTVEMHLGNVYRKLEINSRGQLAAALAVGAGQAA